MHLGRQFSNLARQAIHHAFHDDPQYSEAKSVLRELGITAPAHVYRRATEVYERLRVVRDLLAESSILLGNPEFKQKNGLFFKDLEILQGVMRDDIRPATRRHKVLFKHQTVATSQPAPLSTKSINPDQDQTMQ